VIGGAAVIPPVYRLTLRSLLDGRRTLALALLALVPVIPAVVFAAAGEIEPQIFWARLVQRLIIPTVAAFVAVVIGASAIGDERDDGTILYLLSTPQSRLGLVVTKVLASWTAAALLLTPPVVIAGLIALGDEATAGRILWPVAGMLLACLCYCAVTAWLSTVSRRPVVIGVLYILLWEGSIATFAASADRLSIAAYGRVIAVEGIVDVNAPETSPAVAVIVLPVVVAISVWAAARRLTRSEMP
jgi:ABC-2 type transport system permease protein